MIVSPWECEDRYSETDVAGNLGLADWMVSQFRMLVVCNTSRLHKYPPALAAGKGAPETAPNAAL